MDDVQLWNERFVGKPVEILHGDMKFSAVCRRISFLHETVQIDWEEKGGRDRYDIVSSYGLNQNVLSGKMVGLQRQFSMRIDPSIEAHHTLKLAHEVAAAKIWDDLCLDLAARIPKSCRMFAESVNWIRAEDPVNHEAWRLPEQLEKWIFYTKMIGIGAVIEFDKNDNFEEMGFLDCFDVRKKLRALARAWKDVIRIRFYSRKDHQGRMESLAMIIHVVEYEKPKKAKVA